jgi:uncharacterized protein YjbJ (UPF0337 family)
MAENKGATKKGVGWLTGDRQVEAEGAVEEVTGTKPEDEETVEQVKQDVKAAHGDYGTANEPQ